MRAPDREGIAPQVRNLVRQAEKGRVRQKGRDLDFDMERQILAIPIIS